MAIEPKVGIDSGRSRPEKGVYSIGVGGIGAALPLTLILAACVYAIYARTVASPTALNWNSWGFSEWLINYSGGFTRRGLGGAIVHQLAGGAPALPVLNWIVLLLFATFALSLVILVILSNRGLGLASLLPLLPGGPFSMMVNGEFFYRKELVFTVVLALLGIVYKLASMIAIIALRRVGFGLVILLAWLALPLSTLIHESFIFLDGLAIAVIVFAAAADMGLRQPGRLAAIYVVAGMIGFFLMAYCHGTPHTAELIWNSLSPFDRGQISPTGVIGGGIRAIGWTLGTTLKIQAVLLSSGLAWYWICAIAIVGLFSVAIFYVDASHEPPSTSLVPSERAGLYATLVAWSLPLFALGCDWGRWISTIGISVVLLGLALSANRLRAFIPSLATRAFHRLDTFVKEPRRSKRLVLLAFLVLIGLTFRVPECCIDGSGSAMSQFFKAILTSRSQ